MSILDQYKKTANTQTNALQGFADQFKQNTSTGSIQTAINDRFSTSNPAAYQPAQPVFEGPRQPVYEGPTQQTRTAAPASSSTVGQAGMGYWSNTGWVNDSTKDEYGRPKVSGGSTPTPEPTVGQQYADFQYDSSGSEYDTELNSMIDRKRKEVNAPQMSEEQLYAQRLRQYQGQIDATNKIYEEMLREEMQEGLGRRGSSTAIQARSGLLGSDFGQSQTQEVITQNKRMTDSIRAEQQAKIGSILGEVRASVATEMAEKRKAMQEGIDSYMSYLATAQERKKGKLSGLAQLLADKGIDVKDLDPTQLMEIAESMGVTTDDITNEFNTLKSARDKEAAADEIAAMEREQAGRFSLSEGQAQYDADGNMIASRAKTYAPGTGSGAGKLVTVNGRSYIQNADGSFSAPNLPGGSASNLSPRALQALNNPALLESYTATERGAILDEIANGGIEAQTAGQQSALRMSNNAIVTLNELLNNKGGLRAASGIPGPSMLIRGSDGQQFDNKLDTLKAQLALPNLEFLAGLGRMSQEQFRTLQEASHSLNRKKLSNTAMRNELTAIQKVLNEYIAEASTKGPGGVPQNTGGDTYTSQSGNSYVLPN